MLKTIVEIASQPEVMAAFFGSISAVVAAYYVFRGKQLTIEASLQEKIMAAVELFDKKHNECLAREEKLRKQNAALINKLVKRKTITQKDADEIKNDH